MIKRLTKWQRCIAGLITLDYIAFLYMDLFLSKSAVSSGVLKYAAIILCFALAACSHAFSARDKRLVLIALACTLAADYALLFTSSYLVGLSFFCLAHLSYIRRYKRGAFLPALILSATVFAGILVLKSFQIAAPFVDILGALYGVLILSVTILGFCANMPHPNLVFVRAGMALFLLCDIHVALFNLLPSTVTYCRVAQLLMWVFYVPSQLCLALSVHDYGPSRG